MNFFSKCDQMHLLKKFLIENFIFYEVKTKLFILLLLKNPLAERLLKNFYHNQINPPLSLPPPPPFLR